MTPRKHQSAGENADLAAAIHAALAPPPVSADQVRRAEESLAGRTIVLPASLQDPQAVFDRPAQAHTVIPFPASPEFDAALSRAAREGGAISPAVEERMQRDRQAAEEEADRRKAEKDKAHHGPDVG